MKTATRSSPRTKRRPTKTRRIVRRKTGPPARPYKLSAAEERGWEIFRSLRGAAHSVHTDVSTNKNKHLADIYADRHESRADAPV